VLWTYLPQQPRGIGISGQREIKWKFKGVIGLASSTIVVVHLKDIIFAFSILNLLFIPQAYSFQAKTYLFIQELTSL